MAKRYWLMKSEPDVYSIDDLARKGVDAWEGVRNYQARNFMRDDMKVGDEVLFYHSNASPPGVVGIARVARTAYPDPTAFDPKSPYHDPKSDPERPRWVMVDVGFVEKFPAVVPLSVLQETPGLEHMLVTKKGMRLSVQPVTPEEWDIVVRLGRVMNTPTTSPASARTSRARKSAPLPPSKPSRSRHRSPTESPTESPTKSPTKPLTKSTANRPTKPRTKPPARP